MNGTDRYTVLMEIEVQAHDEEEAQERAEMLCDGDVPDEWVATACAEGTIGKGDTPEWIRNVERAAT